MSNKSIRGQLPPYCEWCNYDAYPEVLSTHRIVPGREGGRYVLNNVARMCLNCHRLADFGIIPAVLLQAIADARPSVP